MGTKQPTFFDRDDFAQFVTGSKQRTRPMPVSARRKRAAVKAPLGCESCGLAESCTTPKMMPFGEGRKKIMIIGEAPGKTEDEQGRPFVGQSGELLRTCLGAAGIRNVDLDVVITNAVQCRPPSNRTPKSGEVRNCSIRLQEQIVKFQPRVIITLGKIAAQAGFGDVFRPASVGQVRGKLFPLLDSKRWIGCTVHPAYLLRMGVGEGRGRSWERVFIQDLARFIKCAERSPKMPVLLLPKPVVCADLKSVKRALAICSRPDVEVNLDFETTGLNVYRDGIRVLSLALYDGDQSFFIDLQAMSVKQHSVVIDKLGVWFASDVAKTIQNAAFEMQVVSQLFDTQLNGVVFDTMIAAHILDERETVTGLAFQSFWHWGIRHKEAVDPAELAKAAKADLITYNTTDAVTSFELGVKQYDRLMAVPALLRAYEFFHECFPSMVRAQIRGIRVDMVELARLREKARQTIKAAGAEIQALPLVKAFLTSRELLEFEVSKIAYLRDFLFDFCDLEPVKATATGRASVDESVLTELAATVDGEDKEVRQFVKALVALRHAQKLESTYLSNFEKLADQDDILHPSFNLHTTRTFRSSSNGPNFQNIPAHNPAQAVCRRVLCPVVGDMFLEADYAAAEVRVIAMYSEDKRLTEYIRDHYDMHRHWAHRIFQVPEDEVTKAQRSKVKNKWVFPIFYGSWHESCAKAFPEVRKPLSFFKNLEREFWREFSGVRQWQERLIKSCERKGYVETLLGFRRRAPLTRNQIINTPIQATSFHLLLLAMAKLDEYLMENDFRSRVCGQIHDSIWIDVVKAELEDVAAVVEDIMVAEYYPWQRRVAMEVEMKIGPNMFDMKDLT